MTFIKDNSTGSRPDKISYPNERKLKQCQVICFDYSTLEKEPSQRYMADTC